MMIFCMKHGRLIIKHNYSLTDALIVKLHSPTIICRTYKDTNQVQDNNHAQTAQPSTTTHKQHNHAQPRTNSKTIYNHVQQRTTINNRSISTPLYSSILSAAPLTCLVLG